MKIMRALPPDPERAAASWSGLLLTVLLLQVPALPVRAGIAMLEGGLAPGRFGASVADAGDLNLDGWPDIIVGAPDDNTGGALKGRAFIWFGGPRMQVAPDLILADGIGGDRFGWAVAGIGDVNGDNIADVAVGAPYADVPGTDQGAVYVYFGGVGMDAAKDLTLTGETGGDRFGWSISKGADLGGDSHDDFVVGAPFADYAGTDAGAVYLFLGASGTPSVTPARRFDGEPQGGPTNGGLSGLQGPGFGWAVGDVPSFKGDGTAAFLVGAPGYANSTGRAYLYFAGSAGGFPSTTPSVTFTNGISLEEFGYAVSQAGWINGDVRDDVVIGAPGTLGDRGRIRLYYGAASPASTPAFDLEIDGQTGGDRFGTAVCDIGNHDGTGGGDYAVGAPLRDELGTEAGRVYVYDGSSTTPTDVAPVNLFGSGEAGDHFGTALSSLSADIDGDGRDDFVIGSPDANGRDNSLLGIAALVGSGGGVVAIPQLAVSFSPLRRGIYRLSFSGAVAQATDASLWTVQVRPRRLAGLGEGLEWKGLELTTEIDLGSLAGIDELELRWELGGVEQAERFELPVISSERLVLYPPHPNPFNPLTRVRFELPARQRFTLGVFDARGRKIRDLAAGIDGPGLLEVLFDGRDGHGRELASGVYRLRLESEGELRGASVLLMK